MVESNLTTTRQHILRSLTGAWLLARGDRAGFHHFDLSVDGYWRSFLAMPIAAPAYGLLLVDQYARDGWPEGLLTTAFGEAASYVLGWLAFPVAAIFLTRLLGLGARYVPLIVSLNWAAALQLALYAALLLLTASFPAQLRTLVFLIATGAVLAYQWFVTREALATGGGTAAAVVAIDALLSLAVGRVTETLTQG